MGDIKKLYNYLQSKKVQGLGSEDEFKDGFLNDSAFSQRVYDYVKPLFSDIEETRKAFVDGFREPKNNTAYATPVPYEKKKYYDPREDYSDWVDKQKQSFGNPPKDIDEAAVGIKKANNMELTPQEKSRERRAKATEHVNANIGVERYNAYKEAEAQYRAAITSRLDVDIERAKADKRAKEEEINKTIPQGSRALALFPQAKMAVQWTVPAYTLDILEDTKELLEAPTKGSNWAGSIWAGFRDNADMKSFLSLGMSTFAKTGKVYDICKRYTNGEALTDEETNLLEALAMNTAVAGLRAGDVSGWYRSGEITGDMVEIMGQFLLTGGIGTGATNVVSKAIGSTMKKVLPKIVSKMGAKGAVGTVLRGAKFAGKGAVDVVAGGAVQSVAMPNTYSGYMEKMSGTVMHGEKEGEYSIEPPDISGLQAWVSSMKETQTERLGGAFAGAGGKILKNIVPKSWGKLSTKGAIGALVKAGGTANKHLAQAGVNGLIGETGEEVAGAVFDRAIGASSDEEWKAFWSKDNMLQMIGGFAPMSILGLGMNGATAANKRVSALRSKRRFVNFTRDIGSKNGVDMAEEIISTPIEDLGKKMHKYTQEIGGYTNGELNDNGIEFNRLAAEVLRSSTERDIANEWDRYIQEQEAEDNVNTVSKRTIDDTVDDRVDNTEQTIPQVQQGDEVEYDNARWIVGDVAEEDGEYTFGDESIPLKKGNVLMFEADGNGIRILESTADLYAEDKDNGIESRRQEIYEKYRPVMNVDTGNIIQLSSTADNDNIAYVVKGRVVYDEEGNIDYDKSDDTIYYKVYDKDGNEVDGGTPRPLHLKTHRTEFGKVLSDTPIEEYVDNELYPQKQNNIQQAINNGQTNVEQSTPEESVSTDERQGVTHLQNTVLDSEEADILMSAMEDNAEDMPVIELTPDNWVAEFGQNGTVSTPIGDVKMGDNQLAKLFLKKRTREFGMIKPTLVNPDVIIEKTAVADNAERNTKLLFVKTFKDDNGQKHVHFENVTVQKGGLEVSISSHIVDKSAIRKELANGIVIYNKPELTSIGSDVYLTETHEGQSDLVPTQKANSDLQYKGTTNKPDIQEEFYNSLPRNKKGEIDENRMSAEQKIRYAQIEFGEDLDLVKDYITEQSKALSEKIAKLTNKTGKSVAEYKELAALKADKNVFVDYLHSLRDMQEDSMPRQTVEEAAAKREESRREEQAQREQMVREKEEREGVPDFLQDTPEDARLRGFRLRTGERIDRQEPIEVSKYNMARRKFTNDTGAVEEGRPTVKRTIIDNAQTRLQPSHRGGRANIYHFITEAQPKERTDKASRVSAAQIAANINPEEITGGITAYNGSPIANNRLEVIQGNNRAEALRLMYEEYPRSAETYKQYLIDNAENYGMSADEVRTMKEPIAVDIYEGTDGNAILLGQYTQQDVESGGVHRINPSGVVKHLKSHNMLDRFITTLLNGVDEENTVSDVISSNLRGVLPILDKTGAISMTQRQGFFDERGDVTSGAIDDFKGILTSLITEGGYANINSDFLNLPDSAKTALYLQTYRAVLNKQDGPTILNDIQNSILLYTLVFGNNNKGKIGVDESRREVMSWLMTAQPDFNTLNEDGTYPLVDMRKKFSNFAAELTILYKSTNLRSSKDKGRGLYNIWDDFYNLLEGKGDLFTAGEKKSLQESINENFNIDYVPIRQNERNTLDSRGEASRAGRRGSESELSVGEQSEAGTAAADDRGRTEADIAEAVKDIDVEPTEAQKKAGNYKKGHVKIQGFDITIENPKGAIRKGVDGNGKAWSTEMKNHYGYFKNTEGKDGDHIDVFIGDNPNSKRIFVVDQVNPKTKEFDESKVMLGFDTEDEAKKAYLSNYSKDWKGFKDITYVDIDTFKEWLYDGAKQRKPFGEYSNIRLNAAKRKARGATTEKLEELVTLLKKTGFADVKTGEDFYNALAEISYRYSRPNGTVLGFVKGNTIYLNPDEVSLNTPIHEFGHLWVSQVKEHFPDLWAKGKELFLESDYLRKVQADPNYRHLDLDGQIDEAMARAIGDRGEQELDKTLLEKILDWIAEVWDKIGGVFGIDNLTSEQISNLTLQDFTDMATSELLSGQNLTERVNSNRGGTTRYNTAEETADIKAKAISDGTFMKAPNGKDTNLTERQWLQIRTKAFKRWFGDWEKTARIEKLKKTKPIEITGEEYKGKYELNVKSGHKWILDNLRGTYTVKDTGEKVNLSRVSANEITSHGEREDIHLKSFAVIPQMIENAIFIDETDNYKSNNKYDKYKYYVVGLNVDGVPYTARIVVGEKNGKTYYDHELTQIEKGTIIDSLNGTTTSVAKNANAFSEYKDKRLFSLLQTNSSKVVDENGEPMVVYHGTNENFNIFDKKKAGSGNDKGLRGKGFYLSPNKKTSEAYGGRVISAYISLKHPFNPSEFASAEEVARHLTNRLVQQGYDEYTVDSSIFNVGYSFSVENEYANVFSSILKEAGYDGVLYPNRQEVITFDSHQIKSATDNIGTFNEENEDIRYLVEGADYFVNERFNEQLEKLTEKNADSTIFYLGEPSAEMLAVGIKDSPLKLYGNKLQSKAKKHGFDVKDVRDLPEAIHDPIAIFEGAEDGSFAILTELSVGDNNVLATLSVGKGNDVDFNIVSSVYGKYNKNVVGWINKGKTLYVNKEKALDYLRISAPIAEAQDKGELNLSASAEKTLAWQAALAPIASATLKQDLITATKVIENFENPPINEKKVIDDTTNDMVRYSIKASEQLDKEDEIMGKKAAEIYEARVKMGKQMNQSDPKKMPNKKIFDEINRKTENSRAKTAEHAADCYLPMKHFIETLNKHGYNIADYNNWYMNVFSLASKNEAEYEKYQAERSVPLQRAAKAAMDSGNISYRELENYLILKHGQERNKYYKERDEKLGVKPMKDYSGTEAVIFEEFCKRTGIEVKTIEEDIPKLVDGDPNMIKYDNGKSEFSKDGKKIPDFEVNKRFELWRKQHTPEEIIKDYEEKIGKEKVEDLWSKIRKATQFTLDCQKEGGLTSEDMYKKASGMWEYFVPLRGFDMGTAQDEYDYDLNGITLFTDFRVEQTLGRTRRSVSPLAWTEQMAHITIQQKNKNLLNQSLRRLASVSTARKDNIMFLSKQYKAPDVIENGKVVREGALINPPAHTGNPTEDSAAFERWEASMKEGVKNGTVEVVEHSNVNFGMIVSADKVKQHVVRVYEGGRPVDIIFNTSPSVPRAINGLNHKAAISNHWIYKNLQAGTRLMAQTMTTLNPAFVGKNFTRDYLFANTMLLGREDMSYAANFNKNIVKARSVMFDYVRGKSLLGWAAGDKGSVSDNEYGRLLTEFVMNGGKTGFSQMLKFEKMSSDFKKQTEKGDKKVHYGVNDYIHFIEAANDYAENITRFAAYCTSRQAGRSVERSISDAKELTINFNRKGTDGGIWGTVRSLCAFSNASIQALVVFSRGVKANPKRMSAFISGYTAMAITMMVIARLIGGDDDDYFKLSKYDRQNNLCLPMFGGGFVKIPLPQEMRVFYKLGDEIALCILRNEPPDVAAQEVFMGALDLLPSFAAGATSISDVLDEKIGAGDLLLAHQPITIIQPITQLAANRNFLNYRIYDDNKWGGRRKELPEYRKALRNKGRETYSPNFVVKLSEGIGRLTGGSDLKRGVVEVNPDAINHLMRGYFGGLYSSTVAAINMGDKGAQSIAAGEMKMKTTDSPTMKAFYVSPSNLRYTDDILNARYMDILKEAKKHANVYANYLKEGEVDRFEKETKMTEDEALDWRYLVKGIDKEVQELRNEIATAETTKERDEALRQLEALQREAIDMAEKLKK